MFETDTVSLTAFLLTYRAFATPFQLLDLIIERFNVVLPPDAPEGEDFLSYFHSNHRKPVQIRFVFYFCSVSFFLIFFYLKRTGKTLKRWIETHWYDFLQNESLIEKTLEFVRETLKYSEYASMASSIEVTIIKKVCFFFILHVVCLISFFRLKDLVVVLFIFMNLLHLLLFQKDLIFLILMLLKLLDNYVL